MKAKEREFLKKVLEIHERHRKESTPLSHSDGDFTMVGKLIVRGYLEKSAFGPPAQMKWSYQQIPIVYPLTEKGEEALNPKWYDELGKHWLYRAVRDGAALAAVILSILVAIHTLGK